MVCACNMLVPVFILLWIATIVSANKSDDVNAITVQHQISSTRILSRKKRYLIFPEGSSLQLVFCLTMPVIGHSTIFTIGDTLSLAWELPDEPFKGFNKNGDDDDENDDKAAKRVDLSTNQLQVVSNQRKPVKSEQTYYNEPYKDYRNQAQSYYKQHVQYEEPYSNPRPVYTDFKNTYAYSPIYRADETGYYKDDFNVNDWSEYSTIKQKPRRKLYSPTSDDYYYKHPVYRRVHRVSRRDLYEKLQDLFTRGSNLDGKSCLLKAICEVSQSRGKGNFLEELIKMIFAVKLPADPSADEDHFDSAANESHNCDLQYPNCNIRFLNNK